MNGHTKGVVLDATKWRINEQITIRFLEGDPELQTRVRKVAEEWTAIAALNFRFVDDGPADIRISFVQDNRSWSYMGTDCRRIQEPAATMNFGWLRPESTDDVLRPVVLHEFGHALGMLHEHQNPKGGIKWNMDAVKHDLSGPPNNWDPATIESNMFKTYPLDQVTGTEVDSRSIMMYPIPASWTNDGTSAGFNKELSDTDKQFIATVYPK
ncbi:MAG: hypothetical protein IV113_19605 [Hydrogenophaga sp.]|nr:hypothetical protein [Hydrogenophaga sp.]